MKYYDLISRFGTRENLSERLWVDDVRNAAQGRYTDEAVASLMDEILSELDDRSLLTDELIVEINVMFDSFPRK